MRYMTPLQTLFRPLGRLRQAPAWLLALSLGGLVGLASPLALAREGVDVGGNSAFSKLVPAEEIEAASVKQYNEMLREAASKRALAPPDHPQVIRLRRTLWPLRWKS